MAVFFFQAFYFHWIKFIGKIKELARQYVYMYMYDCSWFENFVIMWLFSDCKRLKILHSFVAMFLFQLGILSVANNLYC